MKLPDGKDIVRALKLCTGADIKEAFEQRRNLPTLGADSSAAYLSICVDDDGAPVAAMIVDLSAAVSIGGALATLPVGVLREQMKTGAINDLVLDGLSEVLNILASIFNRVAGNEHVRAGPARPFEPASAGSDSAWMLTPSARLDLLCTFPIGPGRLMLLCR